MDKISIMTKRILMHNYTHTRLFLCMLKLLVYRVCVSNVNVNDIIYAYIPTNTHKKWVKRVHDECMRFVIIEILSIGVLFKPLNTQLY